MTSNRLYRRIAGLALGACSMFMATLAQAAPQPESGWGLPRDISQEGHRIDWLIQITGIFTAILFVIMCVWMVVAVVKHNKNHEAEYDHGNARHQVRFAAALSALIFFVVDGNLWVNSTLDVNAQRPEPARRLPDRRCRRSRRPPSSCRPWRFFRIGQPPGPRRPPAPRQA